MRLSENDPILNRVKSMSCYVNQGEINYFGKNDNTKGAYRRIEEENDFNKEVYEDEEDLDEDSLVNEKETERTLREICMEK